MQMLEQQHALDLIELIKRSVATHCVERYRKVSDRVKNLRKKHMNENVIPVLDSNCKLEKSDRRASVNINVGDASFRERDFYNAMRLYNEALCCAHSSKVLARGYSHRSAIYLVWGKYEICLENIREAERYGVSDEEQVKLDDRKRICNEHLAKESGPPPAQPFSSRWKMPAGVYSTAPFIADSVRRLYTKRYGNHILANEDLEVGTVIAMEPAYCSVTMPYVKYLRCSRCTKENWFNLIPCPECPFTMFCSKECQVAAQTEYHDIECAIIGALSTKLSPNNMVAARIAIKLIKQFETAEELKRFIEAKDRRHSDVFRVDYVRSLKDARALYAPIHSLTKSDSDVSRKEVYMHTFATVIVSHLLIKHTVMGKLFQTSEQQEVLMNLLNHLSMVCAMNAQHTTLLSGMTNTDKNDFNEFLFCGWGIHPFSALFNHSCTPNVVFIKDGTTNVIVVSRPIKRDQQLHVCYGIHHARVPIANRLELMKLQYKFDCKCTACAKNYQQVDLGTEFQDHPVMRNPEAMEKNKLFDKQYANENVDRYRDYLNSIRTKDYSTAELVCAENLYRQFLQIDLMDEQDIPVMTAAKIVHLDAVV